MLHRLRAYLIVLLLSLLTQLSCHRPDTLLPVVSSSDEAIINAAKAYYEQVLLPQNQSLQSARGSRYWAKREAIWKLAKTKKDKDRQDLVVVPLLYETEHDLKQNGVRTLVIYKDEKGKTNSIIEEIYPDYQTLVKNKFTIDSKVFTGRYFIENGTIHL